MNIVPNQAYQALEAINEIVPHALIGVYLYGSAVLGGLRENSDTDILVMLNHGLAEATSAVLFRIPI